MNKIQAAADKYARESSLYGERDHDQYAAFIAGAEWFAEQLTSDGGQRSAIAAYGDFDDGENDHAKWSRVLGAVRKEIKG